MSIMVIILRVLLSGIMGALVGLEREIHGCAAGLRTHILVCIGSTLFMATSVYISIGYGHLGGVDPSRIAAGVVTGIGFLGAGAIIRYGSSIRGLTTAASIWAVAAIGLAIGAGMYAVSAVTTIIIMVVLFLSHLEEYFQLKKRSRKLMVRFRDSGGDVCGDDLKGLIEAYGGKITQTTTEGEKKEGEMILVFDILMSRTWCRDLIEEISSLPYVKKVTWK